MDNTKSLLKAVEIAGTQKALAVCVGVSQQTVWAWISRKSVPAEHCPAIERATSGAVRCEDLRPDVDWSYLRGSAPIAQEAACTP